MTFMSEIRREGEDPDTWQTCKWSSDSGLDIGVEDEDDDADEVCAIFEEMVSHR